MREKWKALTKRERRLFAAALVFLALAVLLRFVPGLRFSALLCLCATAVLFIFYLLEHFARRGHRAAAWCELALIAARRCGADGSCSRCSPQASSSLPRWRQWSFAARLRRKQTNR